jgi:DNA-directed RNA polymerase specialized sigma24 family protein
MAAEQVDETRRILARVEPVMRRVKRALYWGHSRDTSDFVQSLLEKWIRSEEFLRLTRLRSDELHFYRSAHDFVVDRLRERSALKRKAAAKPVDEVEMLDENDFRESVADAEVLAFVRAEVAKMERGIIRTESKKLLRNPVETGLVLRMTMEGASNSDIAKKLKLSTGTVSNRLQEGSAYLAKSLLTTTKSDMA